MSAKPTASGTIVDAVPTPKYVSAAYATSQVSTPIDARRKYVFPLLADCSARKLFSAMDEVRT